MLNSSLFAIIEEAGTAVMILGEDLERGEFLASRLTRSEVQRQMLIMAGAIDCVPAESRLLLPELEWDGWGTLRRALPQGQAGADDAVWFALRSLVPATLMWLQIYRQNQPELFAFTI